MCPGGGMCYKEGLYYMAKEFSYGYKEELIRRNDIIDVVRNYVQLKRRGDCIQVFVLFIMKKLRLSSFIQKIRASIVLDVVLAAV